MHTFRVYAQMASRNALPLFVRYSHSSQWRVSQPHELTNLRNISLDAHPNESAAETRLRNDMAALYQWQTQFWSEHNKNFLFEKTRFMEEQRARCGHVEADIAVFYKIFLDRNQRKHREYNGYVLYIPINLKYTILIYIFIFIVM